MHLPNYKISVYNTIIQDSITDSEPTEAEPTKSCVCVCVFYMHHVESYTIVWLKESL